MKWLPTIIKPDHLGINLFFTIWNPHTSILQIPLCSAFTSNDAICVGSFLCIVDDLNMGLFLLGLEMFAIPLFTGHIIIWIPDAWVRFTAYLYIFSPILEQNSSTSGFLGLVFKWSKSHMTKTFEKCLKTYTKNLVLVSGIGIWSWQQNFRQFEYWTTPVFRLRQGYWTKTRQLNK